ncbi:MAG: gamma-glutamyltransferase, partial [Bryobacteraceae bacterium]
MRPLHVLLSLVLFMGSHSQTGAMHPVRSRHAMVVSEEPLATSVGAAVLKSGGNAIDAAVAVGFALAVTLPAAGNIGGGGFLLARFTDGRTTFIDFRERAPQAASRDMYLSSSGELTRDSIEGWRAPGVPGTVRGLEYAHRKYGSKKWSELLAPAVELAEKGFEVSYGLSESLKGSSRLRSFPESRRIFLNNGKTFEPGDRITQPELARTLSRIARRGAREFYVGKTARKLARAMASNGGLITLEDLKNYEPVERAPLTGSYKGYSIITAPPPSSGGIGLLQMLGVLEGSAYQAHGWGSAAAIHFVAETMKRYYADRSEFLGDPDFIRVPVESLLSPAYISELRASIDPEKATPSGDIRPGIHFTHESSETTHFSIVDAEGNAVALTYTLNGSYGSGVTVPELGFLLNNEMDDFSAKPGEPNMFGLVQGEF